MGLPKGTTNNKAGRPKGSKSKVSTSLRARVIDYLGNNFTTFEKDIQLLEPKDRVQAYMKLLTFGLPTLQSVDSKTEIVNKMEKLSIGQLEQMVDQILNENG